MDVHHMLAGHMHVVGLLRVVCDGLATRALAGSGQPNWLKAGKDGDR
jgi:hypothetical protein